jgi:hypothetical protein
MSPSAIDNKAAAINRIVIGLLNCNRNRIIADECELALKLFLPYCLSRLLASVVDNPFKEQEIFLKASSGLSAQKVSVEGFVEFGCMRKVIVKMISVKTNSCFCNVMLSGTPKQNSPFGIVLKCNTLATHTLPYAN